MKIGRSLQLLGEEIKRRIGAKDDLIAPVDKIAMTVDKPFYRTVADKDPVLAIPPPRLVLAGGDGSTYDINRVAHAQMSEFTKIPGDYYQTLLREDPGLLVANFNARVLRAPEKRRMVRTLDGVARAFLSDGYRVLENEDLAEAVLPVLEELGVQILSAEITDTRFYIKAVDRRVLRDVPTGAKLGDGHVRVDTCSPAITIANSEVGFGALVVETSVWTDFCTNLCSFGATMRKQHSGKRAEMSDEVYAMLTDDTKRLADAALWAQTRDIVRGAFNTAIFDATLVKLGNAAKQKIEGDVVEVVKRVAKRYTLSEGERSAILTNLIQGGDLTRYGLHAAVTRTAEDLPDYDRASQFERLGGTLVTLPQDEWKALADAA